MKNGFRNILGSDAFSGRFTRYLLVGGSAAIVDLGGFVFLKEMDFRTPPAAAISFVFAAIYNFILSSAVVFRIGSTWRRFILFMVFGLLGLSFNTGVTTLAAAWLPDVLAKVGGICTAFGINFWMNNFVVFHQKQEARDPPREL